MARSVLRERIPVTTEERGRSRSPPPRSDRLRPGLPAGWRGFNATRIPPEFANVPTWFVALPTRSRWVVLWNNSFLCDGYDSLCWCLTRNHGLTTVHWSAHDTTTTFQPGAAFHHRRRDGEALVERSVSCSATDGRWAFAERGEPLPEEDLSGYGARRKRDRLDERRVAALLARLGAEPWAEGFYEVADRPCFVVRRTAPPATVHTRPPAAVVARR